LTGVVKRHRSSDVVLKTDGNPEGKGLNGFLLDWYQSEPRGVVAKPQRQILAEFFTTMLILSARFKYKPVIGVSYYLYLNDDEWSLSLIAPDEWSPPRDNSFAGLCVLQRDMTWTIKPSDQLKKESPVSEAVARFYDAFDEMLNTDLTLEEILPFYVGKMHYYPRLYASALSRSVRGSVILGDQTSIPSRLWRNLLPRVENVLLASAKAPDD
jgi:hypothetical protein